MQFPPKGMVATGVVSPAPVFAKGADGVNRPTGEQGKDTAGVPMWDVEVMMTEESFGRDRNFTTTVRVASPTQPVVKKYETPQFAGLTANTRGTHPTYWSAAGLGRPRAE